jgi:chromosome segregation ATPase
MTDSRAAPRESLTVHLSSGSRAVQERAERILRERSTVEVSLGQLRAEEQSLLAEVSSLRTERGERAEELAEAREHLSSLEATLASEELNELARAHDLASARRKLEGDRTLASQLELEILELRRQMSFAQERLGSLVTNVLRIQHKLWQAAQRTGESPMADR